MDEIETALTIWEKIDALDVPSLAVLTVVGFWYLHRSFTKSLSSNQDAFVAAMHAIEKRLATDQVTSVSVTRAFEEHVKHDREDFTRLFDKLDETRQATQDSINMILLEVREG